MTLFDEETLNWPIVDGRVPSVFLVTPGCIPELIDLSITQRNGELYRGSSITTSIGHLGSAGTCKRRPSPYVTVFVFKRSGKGDSYTC